MKSRILGLLLILILSLTLGTAVFGQQDTGANYWPKANWRTSTPEQQGMDSENIYSMLKAIKKKKELNLHSLLIVRNGYLVTECYFAPYHWDVKQNIYSCTKSVTSAVMGIVVGKGLIRDIYQPAVGFFPEYTFMEMTDRKKAITIEHLLTMTSGLESHEDMRDTVSTTLAKDPVKFVLDNRVFYVPGTHFNYDSGSSHVLSAIVQKASGTTTLAFAQKFLFNPIGIKDAEWSTDPKGIPWGGMNLFLAPRDMARFGYLFLQNGVWDGKQIIPADWVAASTREHINFNPGLMNTGSYGYQWWITRFGYYAMGHGGQYIYVVPRSNMVVVITGGSPMKEENRMDTFIEKYLITAVKSDEPLPPNTKVKREIKNFCRYVEFPVSRPVRLPTTAIRISGKVYQCEFNQFHFKTISLTFSGGQKSTGSLKVTWDNEDQTEPPMPVGLDGVYRQAESKVKKTVYAFKGEWLADNVFIVHSQDLREVERVDLKFTFDRDSVSVDIISSIWGGPYFAAKGKMQKSIWPW